MPEFILQLGVEKIDFASEKLGEETCLRFLKIKNPSKDRYLFKIKCTSNELFRIRPPLGFIKAGETEIVKLIFNAGKPIPDSKKHYFAVYYRKAGDAEKQARAAWSAKEHEAMKKLPIHFDKKKGDGKDAKKEKKEEKKEEKEEKKEEKEEKKKEEKEDEKEEEKEEKKDDEKKEEKEEKKEEEKKDEENKDEDKKDDENDEDKKD